MSAPPETTTQDEVTAIVRLYRDLGASIEQIEEQRKALRQRFADLVPLGFVANVDGKMVTKAAPSRTFDLDTALRVAGVVGIAVRQVLTPDVSDLRDRLKAVGRLDEAMVPGKGAPRVVMG